jgi:pimeloyl-ACP methyl ester carboxylesterase
LSLARKDFSVGNAEPGTNGGLPPAAPLFGQGVGEGVEECWMDFDGARMRYLQAGSGPPLILLHGLMGYSFSWRYALPAVAPYSTAYALDMLGAGFSDRPRIDHSMRATALRVLQFAENLGIDSLDLLGTSRGGAVAMCAAAESLRRGRTRIRSLILVAPVNPYSPHGRYMAAMAGTPWGAAVVRSVVKGMPWLHPYFHGRMFGDPRKVPAGSLDGYKAPLAIPGLYEHALAIATTWGQDLQELEALLPKLASIPTLLVWGSKDPAVYASSIKPLARHFSKVQTVVFPGVGHLPYEECPEEFNRALVSFLKQSLEARG